MTNRLQPKEKSFQFVLSIMPSEKLTPEQDSFLFKEGIEKIPRTDYYVKKSKNFLSMFLALESLENDSPFLGLNLIPYTLIKKQSYVHKIDKRK